MGKKKEHQWGFMGNSTLGKGDLAYCPLCNQWIWFSGKAEKPFKLSNKEYLLMLNKKELTGV